MAAAESVGSAGAGTASTGASAAANAAGGAAKAAGDLAKLAGTLGGKIALGLAGVAAAGMVIGVAATAVSHPDAPGGGGL